MRLSRVTKWALNAITVVLIKGRGRFDTDRKRRQCDQGGRERDAAVSHGMVAAPRNCKRQGKDSLLEPLEGVWPY